jgi:hypothetical protein
MLNSKLLRVFLLDFFRRRMAPRTPAGRRGLFHIRAKRAQACLAGPISTDF